VAGGGVDVVAVQADELAPAAAGPGGGDDQQSGGRSAEGGGLVGDAQDLFRGGPDSLGCGSARAAAAVSSTLDGIGGNEVLVDGVGEDHRQQLDPAGDGDGGVSSFGAVRPVAHYDVFVDKESGWLFLLQKMWCADTDLYA
jgi:hypothetical protein